MNDRVAYGMMENQLENKVGHEMESGIVWWLVGIGHMKKLVPNIV